MPERIRHLEISLKNGGFSITEHKDSGISPIHLVGDKDGAPTKGYAVWMHKDMGLLETLRELGFTDHQIRQVFAALAQGKDTEFSLDIRE